MILTEDGTKLYTADEVAGLLQVSRETLGGRAKAAGLADRRIHRRRYYTEAEIMQLLYPDMTGNNL